MHCLSHNRSHSSTLSRESMTIHSYYLETKEAIDPILYLCPSGSCIDIRYSIPCEVLSNTHVHSILDIQEEKILKENQVFEKKLHNPKSKTTNPTIVHVQNIIDRYSIIKNQSISPSTQQLA